MSRDTVHIDMTTMTDRLNGAKPQDSSSWERAAAQVGCKAWLILGKPDGIHCRVEVWAVKWSPGWGHSRWTVRDAAGNVEAVDADRLRLQTNPAR